MRRRTIAVAVLAFACASALIVWRCSRGDAPPRRPTAIRSGKIQLDVQAFRQLRTNRLERAKQLAAKRAQHPAAGPGKGAIRLHVLEHECGLGPAELCDTLVDLIDDCDAGDATTCLAVGQFLAATPPRSALGMIFFFKACDAGDQEACAYRDKFVRDTPIVSCDEDPFVCGIQMLRTLDPVRVEDACAHGMADGCSYASFYGDQAGDVEKSQTFLEKACQLGLPMACQGLAERLSADCEPRRLMGADGEESWTPCYAIDEVEAAKAREIGCAAGWGSGCRYEPPE